MSLRRHFGEQTLSATEANGHTSKQVIIHEKFADNLRQIYVLKIKQKTMKERQTTMFYAYGIVLFNENARKLSANLFEN